MFFPIPMKLESYSSHKNVPVANTILILINILFYFFIPLQNLWVGPGTQPLSILVYGFAHGSFFHLLLNVWFLWVVGTPVNRRIGNFYYTAIYIGTILVIGLLARFLCNSYVFGSSGAVFAITAVAAMLLPLKRVGIHYLAIFPLTIFLGLLRPPQYGLHWFLRWESTSIPVLMLSFLFIVLELFGFLIWLLWGTISITSMGHLLGFVCGIIAVLMLPTKITIKQPAVMK